MSAHSSTVTVPGVIDTGRRVARTIVQVGIPSFLALAGAVPILLDVVAHAPLSDRARLALIAAAGVITAAAAGLTRLMAVPEVNDLLDRIRLGGQSTVAAPLDSETRAFNIAELQAAANAVGH